MAQKNNAPTRVPNSPYNSLYRLRRLLLLLLYLEKKSAVNVWQYTTEGDGGTNESIELLITTDGELEMAGSDTLDLEILGSVLS